MNLILKYFKKYKNKKDNKKTRLLIQEYMSKNKEDELVDFYDEFYKKVWLLNKNISIIFIRLPSGDLITLNKKNIKLIEWVDQSYQYANLLGINDYIRYVSLYFLKNILKFRGIKK